MRILTIADPEAPYELGGLLSSFFAFQKSFERQKFHVVCHHKDERSLELCRRFSVSTIVAPILTPCFTVGALISTAQLPEDEPILVLSSRMVVLKSLDMLLSTIKDIPVGAIGMVALTDPATRQAAPDFVDRPGPYDFGLIAGRSRTFKDLCSQLPSLTEEGLNSLLPNYNLWELLPQYNVQIDREIIDVSYEDNLEVVSLYLQKPAHIVHFSGNCRYLWPSIRRTFIKHDLTMRVASLEEGVDKIKGSTFERLEATSYMVDLIRKIGLQPDERYGDDEKYINKVTGEGLWQIPSQISSALVELTRYRINTVLEIGTASGWTTAVITAYLKAFNPGIQVTSLDLVTPPHCIRPLFAKLGVHARVATSDEFIGQRFDLCFIDGDHSYTWARRDWENVGRHAQLCMFHDINDKNCPGVVQLWEEIKAERGEANCWQTTYHSTGEHKMGIGIVVL